MARVNHMAEKFGNENFGIIYFLFTVPGNFHMTGNFIFDNNL